VFLNVFSVISHFDIQKNRVTVTRLFYTVTHDSASTPGGWE